MYQDIPEFDTSLVNYCEEYIHRASQFLAMLGKNYLENEADDSNSNLAFNAKTSSVVSREIAGKSKFSLALNVPAWKLEIHSGGKTVKEVGLVGQKKQDLFNWLRDQLIELGLDGEKLAYIDHYEVPDHAIDHGQAFPELIPTTIEKWLIMRANANILLTDLNKLVGVKSDIRIWPHHFDTGTYYEMGEKKAIGAGWAIADTLCDNPYLYIYGWDGNSALDYSSLPELEIGRWIVTDSWQGAVLESEALKQSETQYESSQSFMKTVAQFLKSQLQ